MDTEPDIKIPAAYTYFGQFVDHDMTAEARESVSSEPRDIPNLRPRWLNLDCLYGNKPGEDKEIYEDDRVSFRLGDVKIPDRNQRFDVPLGKGDGIPKVADHRNLENPLVRQVHAMFLLLHNVALAELPSSLPAPICLRAARRRVCHQYQWLVRNDFLSRVCEPITYASVLDEPLIDWDGRFSIPVEFTRAAFRFGHSLVRDSYSLNPEGEKSVSLQELLDEDPTAALTADEAIPWRFFVGPDTREFASRINTLIAEALFHVPSHAAQLFPSVPPGFVGELVLPCITLKKGAAACVASGQEVRGILRTSCIPDKPEIWTNLASLNLEKETPLWYYLLLEAQTLEEGRRLGPMGSRIVAETIEGALWANPDSYLRCYGRGWLPEAWTEPCGAKRPIRNLWDLAVVVGLDSDS